LAAVPQVWIPALLRELTQGEEKVTVPGESLRQVIENLEQRYPGIQARLCAPDGQLRSNLAVVVDGDISQQRLRHKLAEDSQVRFVPAISGGSGLS
jgi:molybdopterin synthase sulfur carrier subunit